MEKRILVVDDEKPIREMLTDAFGGTGYTVTTASNGRDALDVLGKENIRVAILDLKMPQMNGVELCRRIKDIRPLSCVYAMTAYMSLFGLSECLAAGFDDYFIKPVDLKTLLRATEYAFEKIERWTER